MRVRHALFVLGAFALPVAAHECWLRPSSYSPAPGARVAIDVCVGMQLKGEVKVRNDAKLLRFFAVDPRGTVLPVPGEDGKAPAGTLTLDRPGSWWIGYETSPSSIELEAAKFEAYLREEGLERIIDEREKRHERADAGRELYSRSVKALLACGGPSTQGFDREIGLPLEIVLRKSPFGLRAGEPLELELHFRGKPLEGALVGCLREGAEKEVSARTDEKGRVQLTLERAGRHLVHTVHMIEAEKDSGARWRSYWSSLAFEFFPLPEPSAK